MHRQRQDRDRDRCNHATNVTAVLIRVGVALLGFASGCKGAAGCGHSHRQVVCVNTFAGTVGVSASKTYPGTDPRPLKKGRRADFRSGQRSIRCRSTTKGGGLSPPITCECAYQDRHVGPTGGSVAISAQVIRVRFFASQTSLPLL